MAEGSRLVRAKAAADYLALPLKEFERQRIGQVQFGAHVRYDLRAIDAYLDRVSGLSVGSDAQHVDEAEAAFVRSAPLLGG